MKKKILIFVWILFFCVSCAQNGNEINEDKYSEKEYVALNSILYELIDGYEQNGNYDSLILFINDSLEQKIIDKPLVRNRLDNLKYYNLPKSHIDLVYKLLDSINNNSVFDKKKLIKKEKIKIEYSGNYNTSNSNLYQKIGYIGFSRVAFDSEFNNGVLYCRFVCGSECGSENLIFIVKDGDRYKIKSTAEIKVM